MPDQFLSNLQIFFEFVFQFSFAFQIAMASCDAILCCGNFHKNRKAWILRGVSLIALFAIIFVLTAFASSLQALDFIRPYVLIFSMIIVGSVYIGIFDKGDVFHRIIKIMIFASSAYVCTEISHQVNILTSDLEQPILTVVRCIPHILMFLTGLVIGCLDLNEYKSVPLSSFILSVLTFVAVFAVTFLTGNVGTYTTYLSIVIIITLLFFISVELGIYINLYHTISKHEKNLELQAQAKLNEAAYNMLKLNQESIDRTSMARHDLKNHYAYVKGLLAEQKYEEAMQYISQVDEDSFGDFHIIHSGNHVISSIMNLELTKARMKGIEIKYLLAVPHHLPFKDTDLCSLITNLVDNAMEGCISYPERDKDDTVDVKMYIKDGYFRICVINPTKLEELKLSTTKEEEGHGYGVKIVRKIAESNGGYATFTVADGHFIADVLMEMKETEEDKVC